MGDYPDCHTSFHTVHGKVKFEGYMELLPIKQILKRMGTALATEEALANDWNTEEEDKTWENL